MGTLVRWLLRARVTLLVAGPAACLGTAPPPAATGAGVVRVPLATCRNLGASGNPCFPTPSEIGSRTVHPCHYRHRGRCGGSGALVACVLEQIPDGKPCNTGPGVCRAGQCVTDDKGRGPS